MMDEFDYRTRIVDDRWAFIEVMGEFKLLSPDGISDVYDEVQAAMREKGLTLVGFDLTHCTTITSSTLAAVVLVVAQLAEGPYCLVISSEFIIRQIQAMNIADRVTIYRDMDEAIDALEA